jgi:hypothetical protein
LMLKRVDTIRVRDTAEHEDNEQASELHDPQTLPVAKG